MPSTEHLERFRDFILQPIGNLRSNSDGELTTFISQLLEKYEYVLGEARRNEEEYSAEGKKSDGFFKDMLLKVSITEERLFVKTDRGLVYKPLGYLIEKGGSPEDLYFDEIYAILQKVKDRFESYQVKLTIESNRKTSTPSFILIDASVLNDAFTQLISFGYILDDTDKKDFVEIFTGCIIHRPIKWQGGIGSLAYFIRGILKSDNVYKIKNKEHWLVTQKCFIDPDNKMFEITQLKNSDPPKYPANLDIVIRSFD